MQKAENFRQFKFLVPLTGILLILTPPVLSGQTPATPSSATCNPEVTLLSPQIPEEQQQIKNEMTLVQRNVRTAWLSLMPAENSPSEVCPNALNPMQQDPYTAIIEFTLTSDGNIKEMKFVRFSRTASRDRAAWGAVTSISSLLPFPSELHQKYLRLNLVFGYQPPEVK